MKLVNVLTVLMVLGFSSSAIAMTQNEARDNALKKFPGKVVVANRYVAGDVSLYEFKIEQADGTVVALEINALTGALMRTQIDEFAGGNAPAAGISEDQAWDGAFKYAGRIAGSGALERGAGLKLVSLNGRLAYEAQVRKVTKRGSNGYDVYVDARTGEGFSLREQP